MPASRHASGRHGSQDRQEDEAGATTTSLEREAAALKRALPFLQRCEVPCTRDTKLVSQAARQSLKAVLVSGEAAATVLEVIVRTFDSRDAEMLSCVGKLRLAATNAAEHRERNASISNYRVGGGGGSSNDMATGAVRMQCWAAVFTVLEAAVGVAVPRNERELLLAGDVFAALDLVERLEPVVAAAATLAANPPRLEEPLDNDGQVEQRKAKTTTSMQTAADCGASTGAVMTTRDMEDPKDDAARAAEAAAITARTLDARMDQRTAALEEKIARLELAIAQQQQQQQHLYQLQASQEQHQHQHKHEHFVAQSQPMRQVHFHQLQRQQLQQHARASPEPTSGVKLERAASDQPLQQQHQQQQQQQARRALPAAPSSSSRVLAKASRVQPSPTVPSPTAAWSPTTSHVSPAGPQQHARATTSDWSKEDDARLAAAAVKLRRSVSDAAAVPRPSNNKALCRPTKQATTVSASQRRGLPPGAPSPRPDRSVSPSGSRRRHRHVAAVVDEAAPLSSPPTQASPASASATNNHDVIAQRLAMRKKEDERRAAQGAAATSATVRVATVEDAVRVVQSWLASRATAFTLRAHIEPRQRAATLLQFFLRYHVARRAWRRRMGRSSGASVMAAARRGCCSRCAVVVDALTTRLAADPLLAPAAVRRYAQVCCALEVSPACQAAVLALVK